MKQVIFIRHAKSDWANESLKDVDRHLNERGYADAYALSQWFKKNQPAPEQVLSSTAIRAVSTALIFAREMDLDMARFSLEERIYEASVKTILQVIGEQDDAISSLMLFGHNPAFTEVCNTLAGELIFDNIPTCGIVSLSCKANSWQEAISQQAKVNYYQFPKNFKNQD